MRLLLVMLSLLASVVNLPSAEPANWPQWRGPTRDGQVAGPAWPDSLSAEKLKEKWYVKLGPGYPGPIVSKDAVFVVETRDGKDEVVRALDRKTGKQLWEASWPGSVRVVFIGRPNGDWVKATPALAGDTLYVVGMRDTLTALDTANGKIRWQVDFIKEFGTGVPGFGCVSSPLVVDDAVYVQAAGSLVKVEAKSGKVLWRALKSPGDGLKDNAFSSPFFATLAGKPQVVVQARKELAGIDPATGNTLWSIPVPAFQNTNVLTPLVIGDRVFTSSYSGGAFLFEVTKEGEGFRVTEVWKTKTQGYMTSPVLIENQIYLYLRSNRFASIDPKDGKDNWQTEKSFGKYWNLIAQKDRILALDETGDLRLIRATSEKFDLIDTRKIAQVATWGHLAIAGNELFIREQDGVRAWEWK